VINVQDNFCDFLVCSAHKFYGPTGIGLLYGRREQLLKVKPNKFGGEMIKKVGLYSSSYTDAPYVFEAGTSSLAAIAGLGACITYLIKEDVVAIAEYENQLTSYLHKKLVKLTNAYSELTLLTTADNNIGIAAMASSQCSMADIGFWLDEIDVAVRVGDHCTQPLLESLGLESILRVSIAAYNTFDDVDNLCKYLEEFLKEDKNAINKIKEVMSDDQNYSLVNHTNLLALKSWKERYKKILMSGKLVTTKEYLRKDKNLLTGCESKLWINVDKKLSSDDDTIYFFTMDSDSSIVKGLANLILCRVNGKSKKQIADINFDLYFNELGLKKYLSESRVSGVHALLEFVYNC
jgi:cysteine desulfurase/selenocysteine lyase